MALIWHRQRHWHAWSQLFRTCRSNNAYRGLGFCAQHINANLAAPGPASKRASKNGSLLKI